MDMATQTPIAPAATTDSPYRHLPIELFPLGEVAYVFDAKNVAFLQVGMAAQAVLSLLREDALAPRALVERLTGRFTEEEVLEAIAVIHGFQEKGFLVPYAFKRESTYSMEDIRHFLTRKLRAFSIFVTTQCNLGCTYCIFGGGYAKHGDLARERMDQDTADRVVDFLVQHGSEAEGLRLDFFGGEPLIAFDLIRSSLERLKARYHGTVHATIASNGTLLTDTMLDFFIEHGVYMQFSIDLDRESHDRYRIFKHSQRGSFDVVIEILRKIQERDTDYFENHVYVKAVITPETMKEDQGNALDSRLLRLNELGKVSLLFEEPHFDLEQDDRYFQALLHLRTLLLEVEGAHTLDDLAASLKPKHKALFYRTYMWFFGVQVCNRVEWGNREVSPFAKDCLPGCEAAVSVNGDISICHKSRNFVIGNVKEGGWDFEAIQRFDAIRHAPRNECSGCFAQKLCDLCYERLDPADLDGSLKRFCSFTRHRYRIVFDTMLRVVEKNPDLWSEVGRLCLKARDRQAKQATASAPVREDRGPGRHVQEPARG
jgi:uncharacterized protein